MEALSGLPRLIFACLAIIGIAAYYAWRWKQVSDHVDGEARKAEIGRQWSFELRSHPAWHALWHRIAAQGIHARFEGAPTGAFRVFALQLTDTVGQPVGPRDPSARTLHAFLDGPKRVIASLDLPTGQVHVRDFTWMEIWPSEIGLPNQR